MSSSLATFEIKSNGIALDSIQVHSIEVFLTTAEASSAVVRLLPHSTSGFPEMGSEEIELGKTFDISLGYDSQNQSIFSGPVSSQELMVTQVGGADITVVCNQQTIAATGDSGLELTYGDNILEMDLANNKQGISGVIKIEGVYLEPGQTITLNGTSEAFDGTHEVRGVLHDVAEGNWWTELHIGLQSDEWHSH